MDSFDLPQAPILKDESVSPTTSTTAKSALNNSSGPDLVLTKNIDSALSHDGNEEEEKSQQPKATVPIPATPSTTQSIRTNPKYLPRPEYQYIDHPSDESSVILDSKKNFNVRSEKEIMLRKLFFAERPPRASCFRATGEGITGKLTLDPAVHSVTFKIEARPILTTIDDLYWQRDMSDEVFTISCTFNDGHRDGWKYISDKSSPSEYPGGARLIVSPNKLDPMKQRYARINIKYNGEPIYGSPFVVKYSYKGWPKPQGLVRDKNDLSMH